MFQRCKADHKRNRPALSLALGTCLAMSSTQLQAEDVTMDFSGFASIVAAKTITSSQGNLDNIKTETDFSSFNQLGLRLNVDLKQMLNFTVQIQAPGAKDYQPQVDWLYVSYAITPEMRITAGRTRLPLFLYSNVLDVGYAYQWIAPPYSVYGVPSIHSNDGLEFNYVADIADNWTSDLTLWAGQSTEELAELSDADLEIRDAVGAAWAVEHDWLTLRAVYYTGMTSVDLDAVPSSAAALNGLDEALGLVETTIAGAGLPPVNFNQLRSDLRWNNKRAHFIGLGTIMDFDQYFFISEATAIRVDETIGTGNLNSFYVMGGYRLGSDWTLSLTYSYDYDEPNQDVYAAYDQATQDYLGVDQGLTTLIQAVGDGLKEDVEQQQGSIKKTITVGARWDFHPNAAFKAEYLWQNDAGEGVAVQRPQALRAAIDLVF